MCSTGAAEASFEWLLPVPFARPVNTGVSWLIQVDYRFTHWRSQG